MLCCNGEGAPQSTRKEDKDICCDGPYKGMQRCKGDLFASELYGELHFPQNIMHLNRDWVEGVSEEKAPQRSLHQTRSIALIYLVLNPAEISVF